MHIKKDIDFIIVDSGPGGATVAKELSQRKKKVNLKPVTWRLTQAAL